MNKLSKTSSQKVALTNQTSVPYKQEFAKTEFVLIEFDCVRYFN